MKINFGMLLLLVCGAFGYGQEERSWSRFRGPNGEGKGPLVHFGSNPNLQSSLVWKTEIPGDGNGSPVTWDKTIYLQSSENLGSDRALIALDLSSGKILWKASIKGTNARIHPKNSMASSTPACGPKGVYSVFWDGTNLTVTAHGHDGKIQWSTDLGTYKSQHGAGHSPVFHDGKVYVNFDQDNKAEVVSIDATDGKILWRTSRPPFRSSYSTPILRKMEDGKTELVVASTAGFAGYDLLTGVENWANPTKHAKNPLRMVSSPVLLPGGLIFAGGGDGSGERQALAVPAGKNDAAPVWQDIKSFPYVPTSLAVGENIISLGDKGFLTINKAATGEQLTQIRLGGIFSASPVLSGKDLVIAVSETGKIILINPLNPKMKPTSIEVGEEVFATPALHGGLLFIKGRKTLFCLGQPKTQIEGHQQ